jgi:hypothetical protein
MMLKLCRDLLLWLLLLPFAFQYAGIALNQAAVIANHDTMPVLVNQAKASHVPDDIHAVMDSQTRLKFLCDIFDARDAIYSLGDGFLFFGLWLEPYAFFLWALIMIYHRIAGNNAV